MFQLNWSLAQRRTRLVALLAVLGMAGMVGLAAGVEIVRPIAGDFFAMWSFAGFGLSHPAAAIYDPDALHAFQVQLNPDFVGHFPFPYPPTYLLPLLPFGVLPIGVGWAVWTALGLGAWLLAMFAGPMQRPALMQRSGRVRGPELMFALMAPSTVMSVISGQNGFLSAALMIGGARLMRRRPVAGGVLFGLLTFKPQLGLMVPVALLAGRRWRCIAAATTTALLFAAVAAAAFGWSIWTVWLAALRTHWDIYVVSAARVHGKMPTVSAELALLGASPLVAGLAQAVVSVGAAVLVWRTVQRGPDNLAMAALLVGSFLATPYALFYDLPSVTFAVLLLIRAVEAAGGRFALAELLAVLLAVAMPYAQFLKGAVPLPIQSFALAALFAVIVRRALTQPAAQTSLAAAFPD